MIRLILCIISLIFFMIYSIIDAIVYYFVSQVDLNLAKKISRSAVCIYCSILAFLSGVKKEIKGLENIDEKEPIVIIANHRGIFDIIVGIPLFKRLTGIVGKIEFKKVPFLSYWMKKIDCLFVDRKDLRSGAEMIVKAINNIKSGVSMWIFPEGTRNKNQNPYELLEFKGGALKIAEKTDAYILPIAFLGTDKIFELHKPYIKSGKVYVNIGKKFKLSELSEEDRNDVGAYCRNKIIALLKEIKYEG